MFASQSAIIDRLLANRQISDRQAFFEPDYQRLIVATDPFDLVDMDKAAERLVRAWTNQEQVVIFGDYDADGVTATTLLLDAFRQFGFERVAHYLPNRFTNGYGLTIKAVDEILQTYQPTLIVTVDCGSLNHAEIAHAQSLGIDVIVTDHHNIAPNQPPAVAVINPKRPENHYPNRHLAGVGVAFTLVRALQTRLAGLAPGQEKWLLDLVAIGTVADLMELQGENRALVKFGLLVLEKTRRLGLKLLLQQQKIDQINAETVGFVIGPRINATGRLESADFALAVLTAEEISQAQQALEKMDFLNTKRRAWQDKVYQEASQLAQVSADEVLVLKGENWHEGVVGIVASRIQEEFQKPTFILSHKGGMLKGSARSFGEFSVFAAIEAVRPLLLTGGGHQAAGGLSLTEANFEAVADGLKQFYRSLQLTNQQRFLRAEAEIELSDFSLLDVTLYRQLSRFEPFGVGNPEPIFQVDNLTIVDVILMGSDNQHLKVRLRDTQGIVLEMIKFNYHRQWQIRLADKVRVLFNLSLNRWQGQEKLQGRLLEIEVC